MPVPSDATDYILNELTRRLNEVASRLEVGLNRMDGVYVRKDVYDQWQATAKAEHDSLNEARRSAIASIDVTTTDLGKRLTAIEEGRQWLNRALVGAIVTSLGAVVVALVTRLGH